MNIVLFVLAFILLIAGFLGSVVPVIPGPPLGYIGLLLLKGSGFADFDNTFLLVWAVICIAVTVMDYVLPAIMTKRFGGSKAAVLGSVIGLVIGMIFFAPWGLVIGPFLGAFFGELINGSIAARKNPSPAAQNQGVSALKAALGAFLAFIVGTGAKLVVGAVMFYYAAKTVIGTFFG